MSIVNYPSYSPYAATPQSSSFIGRYKHREIYASSDDMYVTIATKYNLRPDLLAYELYNNPNYWWVFYVRNMDVIRDPVWDFVSGLEIVVPSLNSIKTILG